MKDNTRSIPILAVAKANKIDLEIVKVELRNTTPEHLAINPLGKVPTFEGADGYTLTECIAIAIYSTYPPHPAAYGIHHSIYSLDYSRPSFPYYDEKHYQLQLSLSKDLRSLLRISTLTIFYEMPALSMSQDTYW